MSGQIFGLGGNQILIFVKMFLIIFGIFEKKNRTLMSEKISQDRGFWVFENYQFYLMFFPVFFLEGLCSRFDNFLEES